uniref:Lipase_3 domain-containing protein n=1 Tax=Parastrongyloides trichosuri TaxID=131310 RepID=A0A0N5A2F3_PARTI
MYLVLLFIISFCSILESAYDADFAFNAYKATAATYSDNNEDLINKCLSDSFGKHNNLHHSSFNCYNSDDSCTGVFAVFPETNTTLITFRGTKNLMSYINQGTLAYNFELYDSNNINYGFVEKYYKKAAEDVFQKFVQDNVANSPPTQNYIVAGHSLGGALAVLTALKISITGTAKPENIQVVTFGQPRIGDFQFASFVQGHLPNLNRLVHYKDVIPHFPACVKGKTDSDCLQESQKPFHHTQEIFYNSDKDNGKYQICDSSFGEDPTCSDNLSVLQNIEGFFNDYHNTYFNVNIEKLGKRGCQNAASRSLPFLIFILVIFKFFF